MKRLEEITFKCNFKIYLSKFFILSGAFILDASPSALGLVLFFGVLRTCLALHFVSRMILNQPTLAIITIITIHTAGSLSDNFRLGIFLF